MFLSSALFWCVSIFQNLLTLYSLIVSNKTNTEHNVSIKFPMILINNQQTLSYLTNTLSVCFQNKHCMMKGCIQNANSKISWDCYWQIQNKDLRIVNYEKKVEGKHLRFSELSLNCTYSFLLYSFLYFMRSKQINILNEQEKLNLVCPPQYRNG